MMPMVDITAIEQSAAAGAELPAGLTSPEQWLFLSLRMLYQQFRDGHLTREQAQKEKAHILDQFKSAQQTLEMYRDGQERWKRIMDMQGAVELSGCELCKKVVKIYDGRDT